MAEVIGVISSVIAVIQISERVIQLAKYYIESSSDTPSDLRTILVEISTINTILKSLEYLDKCDHTTPALWSQIAGQDGPIEGCRHSITELEKLFPSDSVGLPTQNGLVPSSKKRNMKAVLTALAWPRKASKARALLKKIVQYKVVLNLALTTESIQDIKTIKIRTDEIHNILTDTQRYNLYEWLERTNPSSLHNRACKDYEPGTGVWMLRSPNWTEWLTLNNRCLWIHGIPGSGKTILASFLIEKVKGYRKQLSGNRITGLAYYYCYFGHNQDEASPFLRWIISQLCRQAESVPSQIYNLYKEGVEPSHVELLNALEVVLDHFDVAYVLIDAVDESSPRVDLLKIIRDLSTDSRFTKIRILVTSREYIDIEQVMEEVSIPISMSNPLVEDDIRTHVRSVLNSSSKFRQWPTDLLIEVEDAVSKGAKGMFRWAVCQVDALQRLKCERNIVQNALRTLPKTLDETYERIFLSIPQEEWCAVRHAFQLLWFHSELYHENLSCTILLEAIQYIFSTEIESIADIDYNVEHLREICGCLVRIEEDATISIAHYTVMEYLKSERILRGATAYFAIFPKKIIPTYTQLVILRAQTDPIHRIDLRTAWSLLNTDFTFYCAISALISIAEWPKEISSQDNLVSLLAEFLNPTRDHFDGLSDAACKSFDSLERPRFNRALTYGIPLIAARKWEETPANGEAAVLLHLTLLSIDSSSELVEKFLRGQDRQHLINANLKFTMEISGLALSSHFGFYHFDGTLLEILAQMSSVYPLESSLDLLLDYSEGLFDWSQLLVWYVGSHYRTTDEGKCQNPCILRRLLKNGANPNLKDYRTTPLQIAVVSSDYVAVKLLLEASADPNATGNSGGVLWGSNHILNRFNRLEGASPLYICRHFYCIVIGKLRGQNARESIEDLLLEYGAKELCITGI